MNGVKGSTSGMAHLEKYNRAAVGHLIAHYDRQAENIGNESVDRSRSHLNYNLADELQPMKQGDFIRQRCSEVKVQKRKDVNVMCTWILTAPKDLPESEQAAFFKAAFDFMAARYGQENVISAYVHMDETTPHMHFAFVPVVEDKKKGGFKVSAKERIDRKELRSFHQELDQAVSEVLGHPVSILNEATKMGNLTIAEIKKATALSAISEAEEQKKRAEEMKERAKREEKLADINLQITRDELSKTIDDTNESIRLALSTKAEAEAMAAKAAQTASEAEQAEQIAQKRIQTARMKTDEAEELAVTRQQQADELQQKIAESQAEIERLQSRLQGLQWHFMTAEEVNSLSIKKTATGALRGITYEQCLSLKATAVKVEQADKIIAERDKIIADAKSEGEKIISDAKKQAEKEHKQFHEYKQWSKDALNEYFDQKKKNDEITKQTDESKERLAEVQKQIISAEQEKAKVQRELDSLQGILDKFTSGQDDRYCYLKISPSVLDKLKEAPTEQKILFVAKQTDDGDFIIRAARSEKEYLAKAVVQAQELISGQDQTPPPPPEQSSTQTQEDQLPRRRSPRR